MPKEHNPEEGRRTSYMKGFDDAIEATILLLTMAVDIYPGEPSDATLALIADVEIGRKILAPLKRFAQRVEETRPRRTKAEKVQEIPNDAATA